ncbi:MAG TPA: AAA family ATPase [Solirubrobacteraceae bacterium]|nr:AAA family ATPase [Solirubrobacteraceae bacterium]
MSAASSRPRRPAGLEAAEPGSLALPQALTSAELYPGRPPIEVRETHASWVFLAGRYAYKVKKPVRLAFLDYSTLERRRAACIEELRVNRELAPGIYLAVKAIVASADGALAFAAPTAARPLEYAVKMRRFDEALTIEGAIRARALEDRQLRDVAGRLAEFHRRATPADGGGPGTVLDAWSANLDEIAAAAHPAAWQVAAMRRFADAFLAGHRAEMQRRVRDGRVRDGHGDLRCEHVLPGPPVRIVDRIEFDPALRRMDVSRDLAFLAMDLEAHGRRRAARELVGAYRRAGGSPGGEQLRSFHAAYWALVRAKVTLIAAGGVHGAERRRQRARANRLWRLAERLSWRARAPLAIIVCGPPASGKSTLARELSRRSGLPVVSSDVVRKRRAGLVASERAGAEHYTPSFTRSTYEQLSRQALAEVDRAGGVIVDATCRTRATRALLLRRLAATGAPLLAVRCEVTLETALARAHSRMRVATRISDATPAIAAKQFLSFQALEELAPASVLALDAEQPLGAQVLEVVRALDQRRAGALASLPAAPLRDFPHPIGGFNG